MVEQYLPTFKFHDNIDDVCHDYDDDQHDHDNDEKGDVLDEAKIMSHQLAIGFFSKPHLSSSGGLSVCETFCQCLCMPVKVCRCVCVRRREDNQELKVLLHLQIIRRAVSWAGQLTDGDLNSLRGVQNVFQKRKMQIDPNSIFFLNLPWGCLKNPLAGTLSVTVFPLKFSCCDAEILLRQL